MPEQHSDAEHPDEPTLRAHLDERLPAGEADAVDTHLEDCPACAEVLERLEPRVALPEGPTPALDEVVMRRAVRRTLLRTAVDVVALLGITALAVLAISTFLWHPVVIDRGERVEVAAQASLDLPLLTVPGAEVHQWLSYTGLWSRTIEVETHRAVGARWQELEPVETRMGAWSVSALGPRHRGGFATRPGTEFGVPFEPDRLPEGSAVTVEVTVSGLSDDEVDGLADHTDEVTTTWIGFHLSGHPPPVGYSACSTALVPEETSFGWGSMGSSVGDPMGSGDAGVDHALAQTRRALENLAASGLELPGPLTAAQADELADELAEVDPEVGAVVLTGRTGEVAAIIDGLDVAAGSLLAVELDLGPPSPCA